MNIFKKILIVLVFALSLSCKKNDTLVFGVMPSQDYLPLAIAIREGYTKDLGVNVVIKRFFSSDERNKLLGTGVMDGSVIDITSAIIQRANGTPIKIVSRCDAIFYMIAHKRSNILSMADLKNKEIATSKDTIAEYFLDRVLNSAGLTAYDVKKIDVGNIPSRFEMLDNGKVDAAVLSNPFGSIALYFKHNLLATNYELGIYLTGFVFTESALREKNDLIKKMYQAYNMGIDYINTHNNYDIKDLLIEEFGFNENIVGEAVLAIHKYAQPQDIKNVEAAAQWLKTKKRIPQDFELEQIMSNFLN